MYEHYNALTDLIFYVGLSCKTERLLTHANRNKYWKNIVGKYGFYAIIVQENLTKEQACELEIKLIKQYGRKDLKTGPLVNVTAGGEGLIELSIESRNKIGEANRNRIITTETREKLSKAGKGLKRSDECRAQMSITHKRPHTEATKEKLRRKRTPEQKKNISESRKNLPKFSCPYCNKIANMSNLKQWHFNNCKLKSVTL